MVIVKIEWDRELPSFILVAPVERFLVPTCGRAEGRGTRFLGLFATVIAKGSQTPSGTSAADLEDRLELRHPRYRELGQVGNVDALLHVLSQLEAASLVTAQQVADLLCGAGTRPASSNIAGQRGRMGLRGAGPAATHRCRSRGRMPEPRTGARSCWKWPRRCACEVGTVVTRSACSPPMRCSRWSRS